jgi:hypothetical protein
MRSPTLTHCLQQHVCLMTTAPRAWCPGHVRPSPARPRLWLPLLGALVCLLLAAGTSQAEWVYLAPQSITRLCPTHVSGDREYAGHGPEVMASAELSWEYYPVELRLLLTMTQVETRADWSAAFLQTVFPIYHTSGKIITYVWNAKRSEVNYTDTDHDVDWFYPADNLVEAFAIMGDTSGNDIGNCTADDAYLSVYLEPIWVWVQ